MDSVFANVRPKPAFKGVLPGVRLHYLGQAAFILQFGQGLSVLTDYDPSGSPDSENPLHTFKNIQIDIATCSHQKIDPSCSNRSLEIVHVLTQETFQGTESLCLNGIKITPIVTDEQARRENVGFIFAYRGLAIVHAGNILNDIARLRAQTVQRYFKRIFPNFIDLLLLPIGRSSESFEMLTAFIELLRPRRVIPMQYQSPQTKEDFLEFLATQNATGGTQYQMERIHSAEYALASNADVSSSIRIISLEPEPFQGMPIHEKLS